VLDDPARSPVDDPATTRRPTDDDDDALVCTACVRPITRARHAVERAGAHAHTFVNPGGFVHDLRCFGFAEGLAELGAPAPGFSWFPGWTWQIVHCAGCGVHLGWRYRCARETFWGLLAARLRPRAG